MSDYLAYILHCLLTRSDTWYITSSFLNIIGNLFWVKLNHRIKEGEEDHQKEVHTNSQSSRVFIVDIEV